MDAAAAIVIALLALVGAVVSPVLVSVLAGRQRHRDQVADWDRQDTVANRLESKQAEAAKAAADVAAALKRSDAAAVAANAGIDGKLQAIHGLVDGNLSRAIENELRATEAQAALLREVTALNQAAGRGPSPAALEALAAIEASVVDLRRQVAERAELVKTAAAQVSASE